MTVWPRYLELLRLSPEDTWTLDEACLGTLIIGATGSGKTSGPFQYVTRSFLRAGFGGLFLCAKIQSFNDCMNVITAEHREKDVVVFDLPETEGTTPPLCFNFLTYEAQRYGQGKVIIENVINLLSTASEAGHPSPSQNEDKFFEGAKTQLLWHCLEVVIALTGQVDFDTILEIIQTLPLKTSEVEDGRDGKPLRSLELIREADRKSNGTRAYELNKAWDYFTREWPTLGDRTRSSIAITLSVFLHKILSFPLRQLFTGELTISPDHILKGGIVLVKLNIPEHEIVSKFAGVIWKYCLQRAIERRPELATQPIETVRPIFIAVDEAQFWITKSDQLFQTTARSTRGLTVYATQNISNFYAEMATDSAGRARVDSLLGNLQNRFFCQNLQHETNLWASESIGKVTIRRMNVGDSSGMSVSNSRGGSLTKSVNSNQGWAEQLDYDVQPRVFTTLARGGVRKELEPEDTTQRDGIEIIPQALSNNGSALRGQAEALVVIAGREFEVNRERWLRVLFEQFTELPPWIVLSTEKPWAAIISGKTKKNKWASFRDTVPLTPSGLRKAWKLWNETRKVDRE